MQLFFHLAYSNLQGPQIHRNERDSNDYPFSTEHHPVPKPPGGRFHSLPKTSQDCSSPFTKGAFGIVTLSTIAILVWCIKIVMFISSTKVFAAPPRSVAPATWLRILQTFKTLMETLPRSGTKNFTELQLIGTTLLHLQQSVILFLLYLLCGTLSCKESEWHWFFPKLWCHLLKSKTKYLITYQLL